MGYPEKIETLGEHIRAARLERGQYLKHVGELIGVTMDTVLNWEQNYCSPAIAHYPKLMVYLGYCPLPQCAGNGHLGTQVRLHRVHRGLSIRAAACEIGVDPASLARWEKQENEPSPKYRRLLMAFTAISNPKTRT